MIFILFLLLLVFLVTPVSFSLLLTSPNSDHLIVLSHGLMGTGEDLGYLASLLKKRGINS